MSVGPWDPSTALTERFKYMFQKLVDKAAVLNDMIDDMGKNCNTCNFLADRVYANSI